MERGRGREMDIHVTHEELVPSYCVCIFRTLLFLLGNPPYCSSQPFQHQHCTSRHSRFCGLSPQSGGRKLPSCLGKIRILPPALLKSSLLEVLPLSAFFVSFSPRCPVCRAVLGLCSLLDKMFQSYAPQDASSAKQCLRCVSSCHNVPQHGPRACKTAEALDHTGTG